MARELNDFQKRKILKVFSTFFDVNNDGVIEWADFEICIQKVSGMHGWDTGSEKYTTAMETLRLIWEGLRTFADENQDDKITREEWLKMWQDTMSSGDKELPEWQQRYMTFMFEVNDTSGDKLIDKDEYTAVYTNYGLTKEDCEECFNKFSENGTVNPDLFRQLWVEYFTSADPAARGNFIFGNPDNF